MGLDFELVVEGLGWSLKNGLKMQDLPKEKWDLFCKF